MISYKSKGKRPDLPTYKYPSPPTNSASYENSMSVKDAEKLAFQTPLDEFQFSSADDLRERFSNLFDFSGAYDLSGAHDFSSTGGLQNKSFSAFDFEADDLREEYTLLPPFFEADTTSFDPMRLIHYPDPEKEQVSEEANTLTNALSHSSHEKPNKPRVSSRILRLLDPPNGHDPHAALAPDLRPAHGRRDAQSRSAE